MGEKEIHRFGAARAVGLGPNLAVVMSIVRATVVPLITLLDSDEGSPTTGGSNVGVIQVGRDGKHLHVLADLLMLLPPQLAQ